MEAIDKIFGINVFNEKVMQQRLPQNIYTAIEMAIKEGKPVSEEVVNVVAEEMKKWAIENNATHYTHWFQPMTGATAEKHESFLNRVKEDSFITSFSGKQLIKGEPDASSFPNGGLRSTFEARGYTTWDPTSFAFIKDKTLYIPTAFCSYSGAVLDKKTPLLRSLEAINEQSLRILRLFGDNTSKHVNVCIGLEQEYFLIDKELYNKRPDLKIIGRTLFGAKPPKGQELDDHYFGQIKPRVKEFMKLLDEEAWKFGIPVSIEHNEAAPSQHEIVPIYANANISIDQNLLLMEIMKNTANKLNLVCLLHEKPFIGVNGSGKHNNWSLETDTGKNLFTLGKNAKENAQFLLFVCAVIEAVDDYQDLLQATFSTASNDNRLGANEAPPSVLSIFLGDELTSILSSIADNKDISIKGKEKLLFGAKVLPELKKDSTDRNRTSPVAFTGNKFEFRSLGSKANATGPNIVINTAVAYSLSKYADILENTNDFDNAINNIIKDTYNKHNRIIYNGNNYSDSWKKEAEIRGLNFVNNAYEASLNRTNQKNLDMLTKFKIFTESELYSRQEIVMENYSKNINIEAEILLEMVKRNIIPAAIKYSNSILENINLKNKINIKADNELKLLNIINELEEKLIEEIEKFEIKLEKAKKIEEYKQKGKYYSSIIVKSMKEIRIIVDKLETYVDKSIWPYPTYEELLYSE